MITGRAVLAIISRVARVAVATNASVGIVANTVGIASQGSGGAIGTTDLIAVVVLITVDALAIAQGIAKLVGTSTGVWITGFIGTGVTSSVEVISLALVTGFAMASGIARFTNADHDTGAIVTSPPIGTGGFQAITVGNT